LDDNIRIFWDMLIDIIADIVATKIYTGLMKRIYCILQKVNVWASIIDDIVIEPFFIKEK